MEKRRILLADDEPGIRKTVGFLLADMGFETASAENGEAALEMFDRFNPHVVLTDIKMPVMDGVQLLQAVKRKAPDVEVVMMTGHGDMDLAVQSLKNDAADFISKPIRDDVLEIALQRAFEKISVRNKLREYTENLEKLVEEKSRRLVEAERLLAVGQTVEGLSSAILGLAGDLEGGLKFFEGLPCFVALHNRNLEIVGANPLFRQRFGDEKELKSWSIYEGGAGTPEGCPAAATFRTEQGRRVKETVAVREERFPVAVYTAPVRNSEGRVELAVEIFADMTEVNRLQDQLRTAREKYRQLFDEVPCYITLQDRNLRIREANRRFKEDFYFEPGAFCYQVYKNRTNPCEDCPVTAAFEDGKSHSLESAVKSKTGEEYNVLIYTAPIRNEKGEIDRVMEMSVNITQIHRLRDQLTSLGLMIGSISHDIKGMLTGLDGGMYIFNSGLSKNDRAMMEEGHEIVKLMIGRIRTLILNILYYAKERDLKWENANVLSFVQETAAAFEPKTQKAGVKFETRFEPDMGDFDIDPEVVCSALLNIMDNALDACVEDKTKPEHAVVFRAFRKGPEVVFEISDNGIGMDEETRSSLFRLFFTLKGNRGTGLGLFVAKKIVEKHAGRMEVESEKGKGSTFRIVLPESLSASVRLGAGAGERSGMM